LLLTVMLGGCAPDVPQTYAAEPRAVTVIGPTEADPGTPVFLTLEGVAGEQAKDINWGLFPQTETTQFIQLFDAASRPICFFWSKTAGRYVIFVDINIPGEYRLILHELQYGEAAPPTPPVPPVPPPPEPSAELAALVAPITPLIVGEHVAVDAARLTSYWMDFAGIVERDRDVLATTAQIRKANVRAGRLMFARTGIQGRYKGLAEAIDGALADGIGLDVRPLDAALRTRTVAVCRAVAWACHQAGK
jgi:hypothetical protein